MVAAGGAGTVLAAAADGVPTVLLPYFPDPHWHGQALEACGAGAVAGSPAEAGPLVRRLLTDSSVAAAAARLAHEVAALGVPGDVLAELLRRTGRLTQRGGGAES